MDPATDPAPRMAPPPPPLPPAAPAAPRWMRVLLVASLALNLLVAGLLLGDALAGGGPGRGPRPADLALGPVARALGAEDRRAILRDLRGHPGLRPLGRDARDAGLAEIVAAVRAEPFEPQRLRAALAAQSERMAGAHEAVQEALLARLSAMTPEERAAFADRLARHGH